MRTITCFDVAALLRTDTARPYTAKPELWPQSNQNSYVMKRNQSDSGRHIVFDAEPRHDPCVNPEMCYWVKQEKVDTLRSVGEVRVRLINRHINMIHWTVPKGNDLEVQALERIRPLSTIKGRDADLNVSDRKSLGTLTHDATQDWLASGDSEDFQDHDQGWNDLEMFVCATLDEMIIQEKASSTFLDGGIPHSLEQFARVDLGLIWNERKGAWNWFVNEITRACCMLFLKDSQVRAENPELEQEASRKEAVSIANQLIPSLIEIYLSQK